ncbi:MAG: cyclic nucleotide-binding domain-containing protein [Cyanobacteria bacterium J06632_3]
MPETGSQVDFKKMEAGQSFGEMSFMDGSPRSCSVQAMNDVEAYCLSKQMLLDSADEAEAIVDHLQIMIQHQVNEHLRHLSDRHTATLYKRIQELEAEEEKLKKQVEKLKIEIDEVKFQRRIATIVESDFFQDLAEKSQALRQHSQQRKQAGSS